jgi:FtsP/CotA-like multicopper oxidase with cupredoxin domain
MFSRIGRAVRRGGLFSCLLFSLLLLVAPCAVTQSAPDICPRPGAGSVAETPRELRSQNGILDVHFSFRTYTDAAGEARYCYLAGDGSQAPTLRLHPGDLLVLHFKNDLPVVSTAMLMHHHDALPGACTGASVMTASSTNLHFHGLVIPPTCHQDETVTTLLQPTSPEFAYRFRVPQDHPPGLYWYHPHPHGFSEAQVLGGASGAMIIEGIERANPLVSGLPERLLIVRDQRVESTAPAKPDPNRPGKDLSLNFVPMSYPQYTPAIIAMKPSQREFWRVLNASADTYLDLQLLFNGKPQYLGVVGLDGVPIRYGTPTTQKHILWESHVLLPPAGRAEFVVNGPAAGVEAQLITEAVETGPPGDADAAAPATTATTPAADDDNTPRRPLARIVTNANLDKNVPSSSQDVLPAYRGQPENTSSFPPLAEITPVRQRRIYFSEKPIDPRKPNGPMQFFITEEGHTPKVFDPSSGVPDIVVHQGDVEDWLIENRSSETHAFHIHQTHFLVLERHGVPVHEPYLRDTINVAYWDGFTPDYPSIKLRMDFRDPAIVGTFPYHCHILQHEDGGMMGLIRVEPAQNNAGPPRSSAKTPAGR